MSLEKVEIKPFKINIFKEGGNLVPIIKVRGKLSLLNKVRREAEVKSL